MQLVRVPACCCAVDGGLAMTASLRLWKREWERSAIIVDVPVECVWLFCVGCELVVRAGVRLLVCLLAFPSMPLPSSLFLE